jgi:hypothetical protein
MTGVPRLKETDNETDPSIGTECTTEGYNGQYVKQYLDPSGAKHTSIV